MGTEVYIGELGAPPLVLAGDAGPAPVLDGAIYALGLDVSATAVGVVVMVGVRLIDIVSGFP